MSPLPPPSSSPPSRSLVAATTAAATRMAASSSRLKDATLDGSHVDGFSKPMPTAAALHAKYTNARANDTTGSSKKSSRLSSRLSPAYSPRGRFGGFGLPAAARSARRAGFARGDALRRGG